VCQKCGEGLVDVGWGEEDRDSDEERGEVVEDSRDG